MPDERPDLAQRKALMRSLTNVSLDEKQIADIERIRHKAKDLGQLFFDLCPPSRNRSLAITALEDSVMRAVKSIVLGE